jgi:maltodextrin utilization protein YvdJ
MAETSYSTTKRSLGDTVRALDWYRQFREIVLMFAITNIESLCEPL